MDKYVLIAQEIVLKIMQNQPFKVFLFGSRAAATHKKFSDIDIGFIGEGELPTLLKSDMEDALEESIVPYKVDLVDFGTVSEAFRAQALQNIQVWKN